MTFQAGNSETYRYIAVKVLALAEGEKRAFADLVKNKYKSID